MKLKLNSDCVTIPHVLVHFRSHVCLPEFGTAFQHFFASARQVLSHTHPPVCMYVCMYVCINSFTYEHVCVYIYIYEAFLRFFASARQALSRIRPPVCMCVCMYICMYAIIYA